MNETREQQFFLSPSEWTNQSIKVHPKRAPPPFKTLRHDDDDDYDHLSIEVNGICVFIALSLSLSLSHLKTKNDHHA